jgi:hypothetical protein
MNLQEIISAIRNGKKVFWSNSLYEVIEPQPNNFIIRCKTNDYCIGLTWLDNVTLNGKEEEFYTEN